MNPFDIIPDTHGQSAKLDAALTRLGWRRSALGWAHPDPDRQIVFLGDFIDRGPDNRAVLKTVRELVDAGKAKAIMGNHELNALHFHTKHPDDGEPLRAHSPINIRQHRTFLDQFPPGDPQTRDVLDWMRSLPLFFEEDGFRAVHACWIDASLDRLKALTGNGVLTEDQLIRAADRNEADEMFILAERITKGPEHRLPDGWSFTDKDGTERDHVRLQWWNHGDHFMPFPENTPTPDDLPSLSAAEVAALPVELLAILQREIDERLKRDKAAKTRFDAGLAVRYATRAAEERQTAGKDTGTVRFDDGDFTVVTDLPKRVDWDQDRLAAMVARIRDAGDDPAEYVDLAFKVPERKYAAWPDAIRQGFGPARTVRPGTLKVEILAQGAGRAGHLRLAGRPRQRRRPDVHRNPPERCGDLLMLTLDLTNAPRWHDLAPGVRVQLRPLTTALMVATRSDPAVETVPEEASDEVRAVAFAKALARRAVLAWDGIGDADGKPIDPRPEAIDALLDISPIFEAFQLTYVSKGLLLEQEKNVSAPLPTGPSAGATDTATPAKRRAKTARRG